MYDAHRNLSGSEHATLRKSQEFNCRVRRSSARHRQERHRDKVFTGELWEGSAQSSRYWPRRFSERTGHYDYGGSYVPPVFRNERVGLAGIRES